MYAGKGAAILRARVRNPQCATTGRGDNSTGGCSGQLSFPP